MKALGNAVVPQVVCEVARAISLWSPSSEQERVSEEGK